MIQGLCFPLGPFALRLPNTLQLLIIAAIVTVEFIFRQVG